MALSAPPDTTDPALERIVGDRMGYVYSQSDRQRAVAVTRWRQYLADGKPVESAYKASRGEPEPNRDERSGEPTAPGNVTEGRVQP